jgi:DNA-directed RNA polymerase specialized sigma24 family protein
VSGAPFGQPAKQDMGAPEMLGDRLFVFKSAIWPVARHQVLLHWRTRRRDRHVFNEALLVDLADSTVTALEMSEARMAALEACIAGLSERQRELLRMFYGENQRAENIARHWGRTVHAVYKALKVMRKALFDCVTRRLRDLAEPVDHPLGGAGGQPVVS